MKSGSDSEGLCCVESVCVYELDNTLSPVCESDCRQNLFSHSEAERVVGHCDYFQLFATISVFLLVTRNPHNVSLCSSISSFAECIEMITCELHYTCEKSIHTRCTRFSERVGKYRFYNSQSNDFLVKVLLR